MKFVSKIALLGAAFAVSVSLAHATPISATIDLGGTDVFDATNVTLNAAAYTLGTTVINGTAYPNLSPITFTDTSSFEWASENYGASGVELFSGPASGLTFYMQNETGTLSNGGIDLTITGSGLFEADGFTNTPSTFILTSQYNSLTGYDTVTSFSASVSSTPEPSSLMLLGTGLTGLAGLLHRRRRAVSLISPDDRIGRNATDRGVPSVFILGGFVRLECAAGRVEDAFWWARMSLARQSIRGPIDALDLWWVGSHPVTLIQVVTDA